MHKINILYVITKLELGGAQKQLLSLVAQLPKEKYNVFLITAKNGILFPDASSIEGLKIKRSIFLERPVNLFKDFLALLEIYCFIKKNSIKIVHTHSSKAGILGRWAARLAKVKIIIHTVHGWSFNDYQSSLCRRFFIWLESFTATFTDRLIVVSYSDRRKGLDNGIGREDKYILIRYGIDFAEFEPANDGIRKELRISSEDLVVGMVACLKPQKSPQDFIKLAFLIKDALPNVKFVLTGDGVLRGHIEELIKRFNLENNVILTGWRRDIPCMLSAMDVFVLTSLWEGLPVSVLEAMAARKPVVITNTGGDSEVISEGQNGFLASPRDIKSMAERLLVLLKDEALRKTMGQKAKDSLGADFLLRKMIKRNLDLYEDLMRRFTRKYVR
jgi:glycosyltransferase involved in cell wall biosynthesis